MLFGRRLHRFAAGLTVVTALAFAVLVGLHGARPVTPPGLQAVLAFDPGALCGEGGLQSRCPACTLGVAALLPDPPQPPLRPAARAETVPCLRTETPVFVTGHRPHWARAPPILL